MSFTVREGEKAVTVKFKLAKEANENSVVGSGGSNRVMQIAVCYIASGLEILRVEVLKALVHAR